MDAVSKYQTDYEHDNEDDCRDEQHAEEASREVAAVYVAVVEGEHDQEYEADDGYRKQKREPEVCPGAERLVLCRKICLGNGHIVVNVVLRLGVLLLGLSVLPDGLRRCGGGGLGNRSHALTAGGAESGAGCDFSSAFRTFHFVFSSLSASFCFIR